MYIIGLNIHIFKYKLLSPLILMNNDMDDGFSKAAERIFIPFPIQNRLYKEQ